MPTAPSPLEEALGVQAPAAGVPPVSPPPRSSFVMNFNTPNKKMFLPTVLALALLLLSLPLAVVVVKQSQAPKKANCGEPGQPPCGSITVGCMAQCGALDIICGEGLECRDYAGNRHCFNASCAINEQIGCVCRTPSCTPTPTRAPYACGDKTCKGDETCCNPKVCDANKQCVTGTQFYCWGTSQCPNPGCSDDYQCQEHEIPTFPPFPTPTPRPTATPTPTPTRTPTPTPTRTPTPTPTRTPSPTPTRTPTPTPALSPTPTHIPTPTPTAPPAPTPTPLLGCYAGCGSDNDCGAAFRCQTVSGVKRCVNITCPGESDCICNKGCWEVCGQDRECPENLRCRSIDGTYRCVNTSCDREQDCDCAGPTPIPTRPAVPTPSGPTPTPIELPPAGISLPTIGAVAGGIILTIVAVLLAL